MNPGHTNVSLSAWIYQHLLVFTLVWLQIWKVCDCFNIHLICLIQYQPLYYNWWLSSISFAMLTWIWWDNTGCASMATELQTMNKQREKNNLQTVSTTISPVLCDLQREHW